MQGKQSKFVIVVCVLLLLLMAMVAVWTLHNVSGVDDQRVGINARRSLAVSLNSFVGNILGSKKSMFHFSGKDEKIAPSTRAQAAMIRNNVSFVYIVGAEGAGVSIVTPAVAVIAKTCNQHVLFRDIGMRGSHTRSRNNSYQYFIQAAKKTNYGMPNVLIIDDGVFPVDNILVDSSVEEKKRNIRYNIEWVYNNVNNAGVSAKFLYLNRDFYDTVSGQVPALQNTSEPDVAFQQQAQSIRDFIVHIGAESQRIEAQRSNQWRAVNFEWFSDRAKCTGLVPALIEFLGFDNCDVQHACELLRSHIQPDKPRDIHVDNAQYAQNISVALPIPTLDISERKSYAFTTRVSDQKKVNFEFTESYRRPPPRKPVPIDRWYNATGPSRNKVSLLYIVGVEGVGHHGVTPAIAAIAKTCNYHVLYENSALRKAQAKSLAKGYMSTLNAYKHFDLSASTNNSNSKVLIIEDQSFPTDGEKRNSTNAFKKTSGKYNLEWVYDQARATNVGTKFLYLNRDFYRAVASHPEFDGGFERHAQVLHDFVWYIHSEYVLIEHKEKGLWGQVNYEWFTERENCTALVSAVIEFMNFDHCDVTFACQVLNSTIKHSRKRFVNESDYAYAQSFNTTLSIPVLDIAPKDSYRYTQVVSARLPFTFIKNITARSRYNRTRLSYNTGAKMKYNSTMHNTGSGMLSSYRGGDRTVHNNVSILYVAGLAGAGQYLVTPAIAHIARSCNYHVVFENRSVRRAQQRLLARTYNSILSSFQQAFYHTTNKVLLLEDSPFPSDPAHLNGTDISRHGAYNLHWLWGRAMEGGADLKVLYLQRDLASLLAVVPTADAPFTRRVQVLGEFNKHIQEEYERTEGKQAGLWAQMRYEWFTHASTNNPSTASSVNCTSLVAAIVRHAGWEGCDIANACRSLQGVNFTTPVKSFTQQEYAVINSANMSLPIPSLYL